MNVLGQRALVAWAPARAALVCSAITANEEETSPQLVRFVRTRMRGLDGNRASGLD